MGKEYIFERQTLAQLASRNDRSVSWVQRHLTIPPVHLKPDIRPRVVVADCTFFTRKYGVIVFKDPHEKECIYFKEVISESPRHYQEARDYLLSQGIAVVGIVLDGRKGVREVFSDIPVQMCHFHQKQIIERYLTSTPKLEAGRELKAIAHHLTTTDEETFRKALALWYAKWGSFINEKTPTGGVTKNGKQRWEYTHRRTRAAYNSLIRNLPFLFTYKTHPELSLPNTTNPLDGLFSHLKGLLLVHRGITKEKRWKMIQTILSKRR